MDIKNSGFCVPVLMLGALFCAPASAAENPMNEIGAQQNMYTACLMQKGASPSLTSLQRVADECGYDHGVTTRELVDIYAAMLGTDPQLSVANRMASHEAVFTSTEFAYFARTDTALAQAVDVASADSNLAKLEQEALVKLDTKAETGRAVLAGLSAARYSLRFWSSRPTQLPIKKLRTIVGSAMLGGTIGDGGGGVAAAASTGAYFVVKDL